MQKYDEALKAEILAARDVVKAADKAIKYFRKIPNLGPDGAIAHNNLMDALGKYAWTINKQIINDHYCKVELPNDNS